MAKKKELPGAEILEAKSVHIHTNGDGLEEEQDKAQAKVQLVELLFNTPNDRMMELTEIPRGQAMDLSMTMTMSEVANPDRREPLVRIWAGNYFKIMRSVGRRHLMEGIALAQEQEAEEEEGGRWDDF